MADDATTTDAATTPPTDATAAAGKTFTQEQVNDLIAREKGNLQRKFGDYDDLKSKASKLDELERANQSELERATGERDKFKGDLTSAQAENLRLRIALQKQLPVELIDRLKGATKEEMEADADALLKLVTGGDADTTSFDGGTRTPAPAQGDMNSFIRSGARRS